MKQKILLSFVVFLSMFMVSCEKEYSIENGGTPTGPTAAEYTLAGGTGSCTGAVAAGTLTVGTAATSANKVTLNVNVTAAGTYNIISGSINGIEFSGSGNFATTGAQTITLTANGTPLTAGDFNFKAGRNGCVFTITVAPNSGSSGGTAVYTFDGGTSNCTGVVLGSGTYTAGTAISTGNTVQLGVNVTTAGTYTISTNSVNGIIFNGSGTFATTGAQTITLTGSGTPVAAGDFNYTAGAAGCIFTITVAPGSSGGTDYIRCKIDGVDKTFNDGASAADIFGIITIKGVENASAANTGNITFILSNISTLTVTPGTYPNLPALPGNLSVTSYIPDASNSSDPGWASSTTVQSFNIVVSSITATRIEGTFSGTVYDNAGNGSNTKSITNGQFSVPQ